MSIIDTAELLREIQPLTNADRRHLVTRLRADVAHQDEGAVYQWLAALYEAGEWPGVVHAMRNEWDAVCPRHPLTALMRWIWAEMGGNWLRDVYDPFELILRALADLPDQDPRKNRIAAAARLFQVPLEPPASPAPIANNARLGELAERLSRLEAWPDDIAELVNRLFSRCDQLLAQQEVATTLSKVRSEAEAALAVPGRELNLDLPTQADRLSAIPAAATRLLGARNAEAAAKRDYLDAVDDPDADPVTTASALTAARAETAAAEAALRKLCVAGTESLPPVSIPALPAEEVAEPALVAEPPSTPIPAQEQEAATVGALEGASSVELGEVGQGQTASCSDVLPIDADEPKESGSEGDLLTGVKLADAARVADPLPDRTDASDQLLHDSAPPTAAPAQPDGHLSARMAEQPVGSKEPEIAFTSHWDRWISTALAAEHAALALQLAQSRDAAGAKVRGSVPVVVLEAMFIGVSARRNWDAAFSGYNIAAAGVLDLSDEQRGEPAIALLAAAGALRSALLMSDAACQILGQMRVEGLAAPMHELASIGSKLAAAGITDLADLAAPPNVSELQRRRTIAEASLRGWLDQAVTRTTNFGRASAAWRTLVSPGGSLHRTVTTLLVSPARAVADARALLERLEHDPEGIVAEADLAVSMRSKLSPIEGAARKRLLALLSDARERIDGFLAVALTSEARADRHKVLRGQVLRALSAATAAVERLDLQSRDTGAAARIYTNASADLVRMLEGREESGSGERSERLLRELALLPDFPINGRSAIAFDAEHIDNILSIEAAAAVLDDGLPTPIAAFEAALISGNISAALQLLAQQPDPARERERRERIEAVVDQQRAQILERASQLRLQLDDFQASLSNEDPLPEQLEREMLAFEVDAIRNLPRDAVGEDGINDFPTARMRLDFVAGRLTSARAARAAELQAYVEQLEKRTASTLQHCREMLASGDLATLTEELAHIERHGHVGKGDRSPTPALDAALGIIESLGDTGRLPLPPLVAAAREGRWVDHADFTRVLSSDRERAANLIGAWLELRRQMPNNAAKIDQAKLSATMRAFAEAVGFTSVSLAQVKRDSHWTKITLRTDRLSDRTQCMVPSFGSEANGTYTMLLVPEGALNSVISNISSAPDGATLLVMGCITPRARQNLAQAARSGNRPVAIIDDIAVVALATLPEFGLNSFFDVGLAWGFAEPYSDVSEQTSIEMFFGRERELRALAQLDGPCLVYGGRQLGKTALLKQVELREHSGERVAIYCKIQRIGEAEQTSQIWAEIEQRLAQRGVKLSDHGSVPERLQNWVQAGSGRSMIIMLDEADAFLENEMATGFRQLDRVRSLMNDTRRRIKFIFAGLHNVQRFHLASNSPLLHFGAPVNVGPLMGSDWEAARRMAIDPMAALGFTFQNPNDATYMLSLVGFYPSLMQSFGKTVVRELNSQIARKELRPPVRIDRRLIDRCFASQEFRADVVGKFRKTLELDPRYELITYALWQASRSDTGIVGGGGKGYPAARIRELADEWWPAGFADVGSIESFSALLDEMEQMGVLAREGIHYRLRSRRIAAMLGTDEEVEQRLLDFLQRPRRPVVDPLSSHRRIAGAWSAMSLRQESLLKERLEANVSIALIGGVAASGIGDIEAALKAMASDLDWPACRSQFASVSADDLMRLAESYRRGSRLSRPQLIIVSGRWPTAAELDQLRGERSLRDRERPVRLIFAGQPVLEVLSLLPQRPDVCLVQLGPMSSETLRHWLTRMEIDLHGEGLLEAQQMLREITGGWLDVLESIKRPSQAQRHDLDLLRERATTAALAARLENFGLSGPLLERARKLHELTGAVAEPLQTLAEFDSVEDLCAIGVLESPPDRPGHRQFNSLVHKLLSA